MSLTVSFLPVLTKDIQMEMIGEYMDKLDRHKLEHAQHSQNTDQNYKPSVEFAIGHDKENLALKFFVQESYTVAKYLSHNEPVYRDSCVEFFVTHDSIGSDYYNFEFNCIGTCLAMKGPNVTSRTTLPLEVINKIRILSSFPKLPFTEKHTPDHGIRWDICVVIPVSIFGVFGSLLAAQNIRGNFYKCGDDLTKPHFLSFFPIHQSDILTPSFHVPNFFQPINVLHHSSTENIPDNVILRRKLSLNHQRETNVRRKLSEEQEEVVRNSRIEAEKKLGRVKSDSPDLLNALIKWYQDDVRGKQQVFKEFCTQWSKEDLEILRDVFSDKDIPSSINDHPFVRKKTQWKAVADSHGDLFKRCVEEAIINFGNVQLNKEDAWFALVQDFLSNNPNKNF